jgi:DNA end-binding protein Ku
MVSALAYADELVPMDQIDEFEELEAVEVSEREAKMAAVLVESLSAPFDPAKYEDDYRVQVLDLIARKAMGEQFHIPIADSEAPRVVDMMEALEASVAAAKEARKRHPTARSPGAAKKAASSRPARRKSA